MGYSPWGRKESDTTERLTHTASLKEGGSGGSRQSSPPSESLRDGRGVRDTHSSSVLLFLLLTHFRQITCVIIFMKGL